MVMSPSPLCRILSMPCDGHRLKGGVVLGQHGSSHVHAPKDPRAQERGAKRTGTFMSAVFFFTCSV